MTRINAFLLLLIAIMAAVICRPAMGGKRGCDSCGCKSDVKKVCKLVAVCKEVDVPTYEGVPTDVFYPDKGSVCKSGYRCDTFCTLHRTGDGKKGGAGKHTCCCKTVSGCKKMQAAKPTGCHSTCCLRQPTGVCKQHVSVLKWVTYTLCKDCCDSGKRGK